MKVLFIGGTGNISTSVSQLAVSKGIDLYLLNRGTSRHTIDGATSIVADINGNPEAARDALQDHTFDCVVNWINFTPAQIERDISLFAGKTRQYIFISSASVYQKPVVNPFITENTPLENPFWEYSRNKIACEERLAQETGFPYTIVRPSLTYGGELIPLAIGSWAKSYTVVDRMRQGKRAIVPGDGTSLWCITHADDFAKGFVGLIGSERAIGEAFHITSDEVLSWNQIYLEVGKAIGVEPKLVHIASEDFIKFMPEREGSLLGDKAESVIFDNSKIKSFVPAFEATISWAEGVRRSIAWFEEEPSRIQIDEAANQRWDAILASHDQWHESICSL